MSEESNASGAPAALVELGYVARSHGLRGEVLLKPFNPQSELWDTLDSVTLKLPSGELTPKRVLSARPHGAFVRVELEGVSRVEDSDLLRGSVICVPRSVLPALEEGEYYLADLVGLEARDADGKPVGRVIDIIEYPAACCLVVESEDGTREVPDIERYVLEVRVADGVVTVANLEDLELTKRAESRTDAREQR